jgi:TonB family protein
MRTRRLAISAFLFCLSCPLASFGQSADPVVVDVARSMLESLGAEATHCPDTCGANLWICGDYSKRSKVLVREWTDAEDRHPMLAPDPDAWYGRGEHGLFRTWSVAGTDMRVYYRQKHARIEIVIPLRFDEEPEPERSPAFAQEGAVGPPLMAGVGNVTNPRLIPDSKVDACYPELARRARLEGTVILQAIIRTDGTVEDVEVLRSSRPNVGFEEEAVGVVRMWRYEPAVQDGRPVDVFFTVVIQFELQ